MDKFDNIFKKLDKHGSGWITTEDLETFRAENNLKPSFVEKWSNLFDDEKTGRISYKHFCDVLGLRYVDPTKSNKITAPPTDDVDGKKGRQHVDEKSPMKGTKTIDKEESFIEENAITVQMSSKLNAMPSTSNENPNNDGKMQNDVIENSPKDAEEEASDATTDEIDGAPSKRTDVKNIPLKYESKYYNSSLPLVYRTDMNEKLSEDVLHLISISFVESNGEESLLKRVIPELDEKYGPKWVCRGLESEDELPITGYLPGTMLVCSPDGMGESKIFLCRKDPNMVNSTKCCFCF